MKKRCKWVQDDSLCIAYHDKEWGAPVHDDRKLFEYLVLDAMQAGLSWMTILKKRENFRRAMDDFDALKVSTYDEKKKKELLSNKGIIRNRLKIEATIQNAKSFLLVQGEFGSFDNYIWRFVGDKPRNNSWEALKDIPANTSESDAMSRDLIERGFKFVGSTICYAFMQAAGLVNDHTIDCFRDKEIRLANVPLISKVAS